MKLGTQTTIVILLLAFCIPAFAFADMGVPMVAIYLPPAWVLLIPIIIIEAIVGIRKFGLPARRALVAQAVANCATTLLGIPFVWLALALIELIFFGSAAGLDSPLRKVYAVTIQSPWLIPYEGELSWMIPISTAVLTIPFYFMSVVIEYSIVRLFFRELSRQDIWSWMWKANFLSYIFLLATMLLAEYWPAPFEFIFGFTSPISEWLIDLVFRLAFYLHPRSV